MRRELLLAGVLALGLELTPPAFPCSPLPESGGLSFFDSTSTVAPTLSRFVVFSYPDRLVEDLGSGRVEFEPISKGGIITELDLFMLAPDPPLEPGPYTWGRPFTIAADAPPRPSPLGTTQTMSIRRPSESAQRGRGGCFGDEPVCGGSASSRLTILIDGIADEDLPFVANYAVRITERKSGARTVMLLADVPIYESDADVQIVTTSIPESEVCVEIAGVGWDGAVGEIVQLDCGP